MKPPGDDNRHAGAAAAILVVGPALAYAPLTLELLPQKALLFALALPWAAWSLTPMAAAALLAGVAVAAIRLADPWEILAIAGAPAAYGLLRAAGPDAVRRWVRRAAAIICLLAWLQLLGAGLFGGSTRAFDLEYRVLTATLGNPNHLGAWLVLAAPFTSGPLLGVLGAITLLTRSHLAIGALAVHLLLRSGKRWQRLAIVGLLVVGAVWQAEPLARTAAGRARLVGEFASLLHGQELLTGLGPGAMRARYMAAKPDLQEDPRHPHNDVVRLLVVWGPPAGLALLLWVWRRLRGAPLWHAWLPAGMLALGGTVVGDPAAWALVLAHAARDFEPRAPPPVPAAPKTLRALAGGAAAALALLCVLWLAEGASQRRVLQAHSQGLTPRASDVTRVRDWPFDPVLSTWLTTKVSPDPGR